MEAVDATNRDKAEARARVGIPVMVAVFPERINSSPLAGVKGEGVPVPSPASPHTNDTSCPDAATALQDKGAV